MTSSASDVEIEQPKNDEQFNYQIPPKNPLPIYSLPKKTEENEEIKEEQKTEEEEKFIENNEEGNEREKLLIQAVLATDSGIQLRKLLAEDDFGQDERLLLGPIRTSFAGNILEGKNILLTICHVF